MYKGNVRLALLAYNRGEDAVWRDVRAGVNPGNGYDRWVMRDYKGKGLMQCSSACDAVHIAKRARRLSCRPRAFRSLRPSFLFGYASSPSDRRLRRRLRTCCRVPCTNDERLPREDQRPAQAVRPHERGRRRVVLLGDAAERLARLHDVHRRRCATTRSARSPDRARRRPPRRRRRSARAPSGRARGCRSSAA